MSGVSEKELCIAFYNRYRMLSEYNKFKKKVIVFHVANEQNTSPLYTIRLKRMGLLAGVADYIVMVEGGKVGFLEFKRDAKCKLTTKQQVFKETCEALGFPHALHYTIDGGIDFIHELCA